MWYFIRTKPICNRTSASFSQHLSVAWKHTSPWNITAYLNKEVIEGHFAQRSLDGYVSCSGLLKFEDDRIWVLGACGRWDWSSMNLVSALVEDGSRALSGSSRDPWFWISQSHEMIIDLNSDRPEITHKSQFSLRVGRKRAGMKYLFIIKFMICVPWCHNYFLNIFFSFICNRTISPIWFSHHFKI